MSSDKLSITRKIVNTRTAFIAGWWPREVTLRQTFIVAWAFAIIDALHSFCYNQGLFSAVAVPSLRSARFPGQGSALPQAIELARRRAPTVQSEDGGRGAGGVVGRRLHAEEGVMS